ncbi:MAG: PhnE/PtxC family ABC transporter permease [Pseudomonadota bacterium]
MTATSAGHDQAPARRLVAVTLALLLLWPLFAATDFSLTGLFQPDSWQAMAHFLRDFATPAWQPEFLQLTVIAMAQTLAIATLGIAAALILALPLAVLTTRTLSISLLGPAPRCDYCRAARAVVRAVALLLRSLPELIWALLFVRLFGLGPAAAIAAIAVSYGGMLAKVYADISESGALEPARALLIAGAGRRQTLFYGVWPSVRDELLSYTVYRWECALRASVIMGFVGAGGLGQQLELSLRMLNGHEAATLLLAFMLLVLAADALSALLRWSVRP